MIKKDQPSIFGKYVTAGVSSVDDGNMKKKGFPESEHAVINEQRRAFLAALDIAPEQTVLVSLTYELEDFAKYKTVGIDQKGEGIVEPSRFEVDALATNEPGVALFLPIADCVGAILYDSVKKILMVSHLGRHSTEQYGGRKSVEFMVETYDSLPSDILVWLSPSPSRQSYPMYAFDNRGLQEVVIEQLQSAGILKEHIEASPVDTSTSLDYFSHSEFKKGNRPEDGRFAIVAMIR